MAITDLIVVIGLSKGVDGDVGKTLPVMIIINIFIMSYIVKWFRGVIKVTVDKFIVFPNSDVEISIDIETIKLIRFVHDRMLIQGNGVEIVVEELHISGNNQDKIIKHMNGRG